MTYVQLKPTYAAFGLSKLFPHGFPVDSEGVHYQNVDIEVEALKGTMPQQFEAFSIDVDRLSDVQAGAISGLYRALSRRACSNLELAGTVPIRRCPVRDSVRLSIER